jgi:hypothetical protein
VRFQSFIIIVALFFANSVSGQYLSEKAEISLLTYAPVNEIHTVFGHSSIRVFDPERQLDVVFNYGMFDYAAPNFTLNFIKGKLNYSLGIQNFRDVVAYSDYRNQTLNEQILNLDNRQKQEIYAFLQNNYKPENRYYLYDFFFDNCATRIRDILDTTLTTSLSYDKVAVEKDITFRELLREFTQAQPWLEFGIDLILGLPTDKKATFEEQMFLPQYLNESFSVATITTAETTKSLVKITRPVHIADEITETGFSIAPTFLFGLFFGITLVLNFLIKKSKITNLWNSIFVFVAGLAGVVILLMWFGTEHIPTKHNLNVIWAFPTHLIAAFWIWKSTSKPMYFRIFTAINLLVLITFSVFPQQMPISVMPILLTLITIGLIHSNLPFLNQFTNSKTV